jgi:hypothetical protein
MKKPQPKLAAVLLPDGPTMIERYSARITALALPLPLPAAHLSTRIRCDIAREVAQSGASTVTLTLTYLLLLSDEDDREHGRLDYRVEYHVLARWRSLRPAERSAIVCSAFALLGQAIATLDHLVEGLPLCSYIPTHTEALALLKCMRTRYTPAREMHVLDGMHLISPKYARPDAFSDDTRMNSIAFPLPASLIGEGIPLIEIDYM